MRNDYCSIHMDKTTTPMGLVVIAYKGQLDPPKKQYFDTGSQELACTAAGGCEVVDRTAPTV